VASARHPPGGVANVPHLTAAELWLNGWHPGTPFATNVEKRQVIAHR
jgi:hypothetical protein